MPRPNIKFKVLRTGGAVDNARQNVSLNISRRVPFTFNNGTGIAFTRTASSVTVDLDFESVAVDPDPSVDFVQVLGWNTDDETYKRVPISSLVLGDGDKGDITVSGGGASWNIDAGAVGTTELASDAVTTAKILDSNVTKAKIENSAGLSVIGRAANSTGGVADIVGTDGQVLRVSGTTLGFGTVVAAGLATDAVETAKIKDAAVTLAKQADLAEARIIGRAASAGTGVPTALTGAQATAILDAFTGDSGSGGVKGVVPAPAAGDAAANKFLAADGTWKVGGVADGDKGDITVSSSGTVWNIDAGAVGTAEIADAALTAAKFPAALDTVALPAIRRRLRNLPDLLDYGGYSDMTAAMDAAHTAATSEGWRKILVPSGSWTQATAPANIDHGLLYEGEDRSSTVVNVDHTGSAFRFSGALSGGGGVKNLFIQIAGSTNAIAAVRGDGSNLGYAPDGLEVDNLWITYQSTGRWAYGIYFDGAPRGQAIVSGTISGTPTATFTASGASYGTDQFANGRRQVRMTSGTASGQFRTIVSNTSNTITMASAFSPNAASGDTFVVETVLYGIRNYRVSRITTFGTSTDALYICNARAASFREILCNGVGGVSRISLVGNTSGVSERNDGVDFAGLIFGELLINNTNALNGFCTPQAGFAAGSGITNSGLAVPPAYHSAGPSVPPISGLTLYG